MVAVLIWGWELISGDGNNVNIAVSVFAVLGACLPPVVDDSIDIGKYYSNGTDVFAITCTPPAMPGVTLLKFSCAVPTKFFFSSNQWLYTTSEGSNRISLLKTRPEEPKLDSSIFEPHKSKSPLLSKDNATWKVSCGKWHGYIVHSTDSLGYTINVYASAGRLGVNIFYSNKRKTVNSHEFLELASCVLSTIREKNE